MRKGDIISFRVDRELLRKLTYLATKKRLSRAELVRQCLTELIAREKKST